MLAESQRKPMKTHKNSQKPENKVSPLKWCTKKLKDRHERQGGNIVGI